MWELAARVWVSAVLAWAWVDLAECLPTLRGRVLMVAAAARVWVSAVLALVVASAAEPESVEIRGSMAELQDVIPVAFGRAARPASMDRAVLVWAVQALAVPEVQPGDFPGLGERQAVATAGEDPAPIWERGALAECTVVRPSLVAAREPTMLSRPRSWLNRCSSTLK